MLLKIKASYASVKEMLQEVECDKILGLPSRQHYIKCISFWLYLRKQLLRPF